MLSTQVFTEEQMPCAKTLTRNTDSELGCIAALRSSGAACDFAAVSCRRLEVIQLQCMAQGLQIGPTRHPPEWHVFLGKRKIR